MIFLYSMATNLVHRVLVFISVNFHCSSFKKKCVNSIFLTNRFRLLLIFRASSTYVPGIVLIVVGVYFQAHSIFIFSSVVLIKNYMYLTQVYSSVYYVVGMRS